MDVKTMTFLKRDRSKHFITKFVKRDYVASTKKQRKLKHIKKVYPNEDNLECILLYLGSALSWKSTADQTALFLLGLGSSGKSHSLKQLWNVTSWNYSQMYLQEKIQNRQKKFELKRSGGHKFIYSC